MNKDYKFWYIRRDDDGFITETAIRFYEGEYGEVEVIYAIAKMPKFETRYIRTKRLTRGDLTGLKGRFAKGANKDSVKLYFPADFGQIKTDDELRLFLNKELAKVKGRQAIKEQLWQL